MTPVGIAMTRDGRTAYVTLGRANHVAVVAFAITRCATTCWWATAPGARRWFPDESMLVVVNGLSDDISLVEHQDQQGAALGPRSAACRHTAVIDD